MNIELCECSSEYWEFVRQVRTDPSNQNGFFSHSEITPEQQIEYMKSNSFRYKICILNNYPVGYIGIIKNNEITYCVQSEYKGKGIGTLMLKEFSKGMAELEAFVKCENLSSQKVFEKLGWEKQIYYKLRKK